MAWDASRLASFELAAEQATLGRLQRQASASELSTTKNFEYACKYLGLDRAEASRAVHDAKYHAGLSGDDDCEFDLVTGDILFDGVVIGNLGD